MEPRLVQWYYSNQIRIDALTLSQYLNELSALVLGQTKLRDQILSSKQNARPFYDWKIELENLNAILTNAKSSHAL